MVEEFIKMDLHIHTPKSDCYKGEKTEDEYLRILRQAKAKGLKVIAITDHNSIEGFNEYAFLEAKLTKRKNELKSSDSTTEVKELRRVEKDLLLFKEIVIFPGIEFEVKNNVHMLVIFDRNTPLERMEKLLLDGGYREFGEENPKVTSNWDIIDLYENSSSYDCIVLDAHTDSNKGMWNNTNPGTYRARCYTHPQLYGIGYKSESQRENISRVINTAREYIRGNPLSFVKFSDAHSFTEVGSQFTWLRNNDLFDLSYLKVAFRNPTEYISVEEPSLAKILDNIIGLPNTFGIPDIKDENKEYFKKLICGLNNSEGGYILFGLSNDLKKRGIYIGKGDLKNISQITAEIDKCIDCIDESPELRKTIYSLMVDKAIFSIRVLPGARIIGTKDEGKIYSVRDNRLVTLSVLETRNLVEAKFADTIETKIGKHIEEVEKDCGQVKAYFESLPIIRKFETQSYIPTFELKYEEAIELEDEEIGKLKRDPYNGFSKGNLFFLREQIKPRLEDTYLRYSLPMFTIQKLGIPSKKEPTIYIVPGGGVFYSDRDYPFYSETELAVIKLQGTFKLHSRKLITCFLKSSFNLYYLNNNFDSEDIYSQSVFNKIRLPILNYKIPDVREKISAIERKFDQIIGLEKQCLRGIHNIDEEKLPERLKNHNLEVDKIAYEIDLLICDLLNMSPMEVDTIERYLRLNNIYIPSYSES